MSVALDLKFQSYTRCNCVVRKRDKHTKYRFGSLIQRFICLELAEERENRVRTEYTVLERENNCRRARETDTGHDITFLAFARSSCSCLFGISSLHLRCGGVTTSHSLPKMNAVIFGPSLYIYVWSQLPFPLSFPSSTYFNRHSGGISSG